MVVPGRDCCHCSSVCRESDETPALVYTHIAGTITLKGMGDDLGFSHTPLVPPGGGPATPSSISSGADVEDYEITLGRFECGRNVYVGFDCLHRVVHTAIVAADPTDAIETGIFYPHGYTPGPTGSDDYPDYEKPYPEAIAAGVPNGFTYTYSGAAPGSSGSHLQITAQASLVRSKKGRRFAVVAVYKQDGSDNFANNWPPEAVAGTPGYFFAPKYMRVAKVGFLELSESGRVVCDGLEEEITLAPFDNAYSDLRYPLHGDMRCQSSEIVAGRPVQEAVSGPTSVILKLFRV